MKIKTSELERAALDWVVAKCEGKPLEMTDDDIKAIWLLSPNFLYFAREIQKRVKEQCARIAETPEGKKWHPYGECYEEDVAKNIAERIRKADK